MLGVWVLRFVGLRYWVGFAGRPVVDCHEKLLRQVSGKVHGFVVRGHFESHFAYAYISIGRAIWTATRR